MGSKFWFFEKNGSILGRYFICLQGFFGPNHYKKPVWEITKKFFRRKWVKNLYFLTLWTWVFGIFDKHPQGCYEVKNSMGLLQGPRLMAWTTKSPIRGNHWVPLSCRALLGSVKTLILFLGETLERWKYEIETKRCLLWYCLENFFGTRITIRLHYIV